MCGSEEMLFKTSIEGSELNVCKKCAKFGKVISEVRVETRERKKRKEIKKDMGPEKEVLQIIAPDYGQRIRRARESLGLKQEDFAKKINEKLSLIHHMEISKFEPSIDLARKLEGFLRITLIEQHEEMHDKVSKASKDTFTIGDFIKIKNK
jgi:putative transcription factor|tara:strand:+ start:720 stop:1172 length:453 start_codon:yes stop_codon:yes gene_type:complete